MLVERLAGARGDLRDGDGIAVLAAVGGGRIGLGHLKRRQERGTERQARLADELGRLIRGVDAEVLAHVRNGVVADGLLHRHIARVRRHRGGLREGAHAVVDVAVVLHGEGGA